MHIFKDMVQCVSRNVLYLHLHVRITFTKQYL